jgi:multisubunit Na+/H+ antiporter MnhB subunit
MSLDRADAWARWAPWMIIGGACAVAGQLALPLERQYFLISAIMIVGCGIHAGVLRRWRTEPGLWMLAAVGATSTGLFYLVFAIPNFLDALAPGAQPPQPPMREPDIYKWRWTVDGPISLVFVWLAFRISVTLGYWNWHVSRMAPHSGPVDHPTNGNVD